MDGRQPSCHLCKLFLFLLEKSSRSGGNYILSHPGYEKRPCPTGGSPHFSLASADEPAPCPERL